MMVFAFHEESHKSYPGSSTPPELDIVDESKTTSYEPRMKSLETYH